MRGTQEDIVVLWQGRRADHEEAVAQGGLVDQGFGGGVDQQVEQHADEDKLQRLA